MTPLEHLREHRSILNEELADLEAATRDKRAELAAYEKAITALTEAAKPTTAQARGVLLGYVDTDDDFWHKIPDEDGYYCQTHYDAHEEINLNARPSTIENVRHWGGTAVFAD